MPANSHQPRSAWETDYATSVAQYNAWYTAFAPPAYTNERQRAQKLVDLALTQTNDLLSLTPQDLSVVPMMLKELREMTVPPIARDRLTGLSGASRQFVQTMEEHNRVQRTAAATAYLSAVCKTITTMIDPVLFPWVAAARPPTPAERQEAVLVVAERVCSKNTETVIRNAQEARQFAVLEPYLIGLNYARVTAPADVTTMTPGTYAVHCNVRTTGTNVPIDVVIMRRSGNPPLAAAQSGTARALPLLIEAKSAGDEANVNKRWKEETTKMAKLTAHFPGQPVPYVLYLCGFFNTSFQQKIATVGIDWVWEHRTADLAALGV